MKSSRMRRLRARVVNQMTRSSGMGGQYDHGTGVSPMATGLLMTPMQQDRFAVTLYESEWVAQKIVDIPVEDMLRDGWRNDGLTEEQADELDTQMERLGVMVAFQQAMRLERMLGGAAIFMGVMDGQSDPAVPLDPAAARLEGLRYLNVIPRGRITRPEWDVNPLSPTYGRPIFFQIDGVRVHRSRLILFDGNPLLPVPISTIATAVGLRNDGFGSSILLRIYDEIVRSTGSRQAAYQMVQRASVFILQADLADLQGNEQGQAALAQLQAIVNQMNLYRGAVVDKNPSDQSSPISTVATAFGSVPELVMVFLQVLSAASDIPATRFLGQAPGGLNATGESDLENYYGRLESAQRQKLKPKIEQLNAFLLPSVFTAPPKVKVEFDPLWSLSEKEESEVRTADTNNMVALVNAGMLTEEDGIAELKARKTLLTDPKDPPPGPPPEPTGAGPLDESIAGITGGGQPSA